MPKPAHETQSEYRIVLIQPEAYAHSGALSELAETLLYGLNALGLSFQLSINEIDPNCTNILLGAHLLDAQSQWKQAKSNLIEAQTQYKIYETNYLRAISPLFPRRHPSR